MKFKKLKIKDYKILKDVDLKFNDKLTLITGNNGTGKSTLFNLMKDICNKKEVEDCSLEIEGKKTINNLDQIFITDSHLRGYGESSMLAASEKIILNLMHILASREDSKVEDPLVFDSPFSILKRTQTKIMLNLLKSLDQQVIIFQNEIELPEGVKSDYSLELSKDLSTVKSVKIDKKYILMDGTHIIDTISKVNLKLAELMIKNQSILDFINDIVTNPGVCGLDFADIKAMITEVKEVKFIQATSKDIDKYKNSILNFKRVIIQIKGGKNLSLDGGKNFIEKYFSAMDYVHQMYCDPKNLNPDWKVDFLLMK